MRRLVQIIRGHFAAGGMPKVILVAPPLAIATNVHPEMMVHFGNQAAIDASTGFAEMYKRRAQEEGVGFFDAGSVAKASPLDGIHLDEANTRAIGEGLVPLVKQMLGL
jgi:lysophospholipase L1-like esterase